MNLHSCTFSLQTPQSDTVPYPTDFYYLATPHKTVVRHNWLWKNDQEILPLVARALKDLAITSNGWPANIRGSFVLTSRCNLVRLTVEYAADSFLDGFLKYTPSLEDLDLIHGMNLSALTVNRRSFGEICPKLRTLKCTSFRGMFNEFLDMLVDRAQDQSTYPPSCIEDVTMMLCFLEIKKSGAIEWPSQQIELFA